MFHRKESWGGFFVSGKGAAGLLQTFPSLGVDWVGPDEGVFGVHRRRQGVGGKSVEDCDLRGRQGRAPNLDLVERAVAEAGIAGT